MLSLLQNPSFSPFSSLGLANLGWILALRYCSALHFGVLGFPPGGGHHHKKTTRQLGLEPDSSEGLKEYFHQNQWNISGNEFVKTHRILWGT